MAIKQQGFENKKSKATHMEGECFNTSQVFSDSVSV